MDKEHIKGAADKAKGAVKDTVGKMTGDTKMQAEGKIDKAKGTAHNVAGDVKDATRTQRTMIELKILTPTGRLGAAFLFLPHCVFHKCYSLEWEAGGAWCSEFLPGAKQMKCTRARLQLGGPRSESSSNPPQRIRPAIIAPAK